MTLLLTTFNISLNQPLPRILGNSSRKHTHAITVWYHSVYVWFPVQIDKTAYHFLHSSPVDLLYAECIPVVFQYSPKCIQQVPYDPLTWSPTGFSQDPPPPPPQTAFSYISLQNFFFLLLPLFSALDSPKILQKVHKNSIGSEKLPHTLFFRFKEKVFFWRQHPKLKHHFF